MQITFLDNETVNMTEVTINLRSYRNDMTLTEELPIAVNIQVLLTRCFEKELELLLVAV